MKTFNLNFTQIEDDLKNGNRVTVKKLAEELGLSPLLIRNEITKFYGKDQVTFMRGRKGGLKIHRINTTS
jgi:DNA-binding IscR family transcriptional regulator|tara:strand:+ start:559 stop:768 length:210 start_codon:yes stop_codon:yes gene_type:complete